MSSTQFIPTGRTSLVKKGTIALQVQTEYAHRPYPRVTTCVAHNGQVVHKIEKKLDKAIESIEEQNRMEQFLKQQHQEVVNTIQTETFVSTFAFKDKLESNNRHLSLFDRVASIDGVERIYRLDTRGEWAHPAEGDQFKRQYPEVSASLYDLMDVFSPFTAEDGTLRRQPGVYEVVRDRLYLACTGGDCYFVAVKRVSRETQFEKAITDAVLSASSTPVEKP
ncbi:MAG: hypothetical protein AAB305_04235 [Candidatus Zixiibacteriota bacterium]